MLNRFYKYQSLGNNFILFDWYKKPSQYLDKDLNSMWWPHIVQQLCDRYIGIGADGVLIVKNNQQTGAPEMLIFNRDGSSAQSCLNGVRCVAQHLITIHRYPKKFSIKMGQRMIECLISEHDQFISTNVGQIQYEGMREVSTTVGTFSGYVVSLGNPHFIIFQPVEHDWLAQHGKLIEQHELFPQKTNVEFVVPDQRDKKNFHMQVYERGCGITRACSSGAAALAGLLVQLGNIAIDEQISISMPGGLVQARVNVSGIIMLQASAEHVFQGILPAAMIENILEAQKGAKDFTIVDF